MLANLAANRPLLERSSHAPRSSATAWCKG